MSQARKRIFERLNAAVRQDMPLPNVTDWFKTHRHNESPAERQARFCQTISLVQGEVIPVNKATWPATLANLLQSRGIQSLALGLSTSHGAIAATALSDTSIQLQGFDAAIEAWKSELFNNMDAGLTAAKAAIAETGTLILWPSVEEPRTLSLVPPAHIVLLKASTIYNTLFEAMTQEHWAEGLPTNALLISGPSKTADIQQTLAYGAHGPKALIVLLIGDE